MIALIGLDNLDDLRNVEKRSISDVIIHKDFKSTAVRDENDIAIAKLNSPVRFSSTIIPVCLPMPGKCQSNIINMLPVFMLMFLCISLVEIEF